MRRWVKVHVVEGVPGGLMDIETELIALQLCLLPK